MTTKSRQRWNSTGFDILCYTLVFLAGLTFIVGTILSIQWLIPWPETAAAQGLAVAMARGYFIGAILISAVLLAHAAMVHLLTVLIRNQRLDRGTSDQMRDALVQINEALRNPVATAAPVPDHMGNAEHAPHFAGDQQVLRLLEQMRDFSLMDQRQHEQWAKRHWEERKSLLLRQMDRAISAAQWDSAAAYIADLRHLLPDDTSIAQLSDRLVEERAKRLRQDLDGAQNRLRHLISVAAWAQGEEVLTGLSQRYPGNPEIQAMTDQLHEERARLEAEQIQRLMAEIKDASDHRQWRRAITLIEEIMAKYPQHTQAELLRLDLPRLQENAEAQERREEENLFKDLLLRHRYEEALEVAHRVIAKYPASPTAQEMNKLLPKIQGFMQKEKQTSKGQATVHAAPAQGI